jgi:hypothetical protein
MAQLRTKNSPGLNNFSSAFFYSGEILQLIFGEKKLPFFTQLFSW